MVQLNLLPDVKSKFIKSQRTKHTVILSAFIISGVAVGIVLMLVFLVYGAQKLQINNLKDDIASNTAELKKVDSLDKILTIQNQLGALDGLHSQKPVLSRVYVFLPQLTPVDVSISAFTVKIDGSTLEITGSAKDLVAVNKFVDTLKFTKFVTNNSDEERTAFGDVVLTSFARSDKEASFAISSTFDPELFSSANATVTLKVPKITSTRSETERPTDIFKEPATGGTN